MAYYNYYQSSAPQQWGTAQYQAIAPPMPQYQPQPSWGGMDYYRAHYGGQTQDSSLFDYVWSRVRGVFGGLGLGRNEAHHWWSRVYGGLVDPAQLLPKELGAAAAYEAIRLWEYHQSIYVQPLTGDRDREREALMGLAIAEAAKLWQYVRRPMDNYGRSQASEVAAATAGRIFDQNYDYDGPYDQYRTRRSSRVRRNSYSNGMAPRYSSAGYDSAVFDDDDYDDGYDMRGSNLGVPRARRRSSSYYGRRSVSPVAMAGSSVGYGTQYSQGGYGGGGGGGIPGMYYPQAQAGAYGQYAQGGGQYLNAPGMGHYRSRSSGGYGSSRPVF